MKNKKGILFAVLVIVIVVFLLLHRKQPATPVSVRSTEAAPNTNTVVIAEPQKPSVQSNPQSVPQNASPQARIDQAQQRQDQQIALAQSPLLFYGKVVDESNQPIGGVQVSYTAHTVSESRDDVFNTGTVTSDDRGIFKIDGINGISLMLQLSHTNYYPYPDNSTGFDKRSLPKKGYFSDSEENAELFRMHSKGHPVALIYRNGGFHTANNGTTADYPLRGNTRADILGQLQVQGWNNLRPDTNYDWKVQLTLPNGGIVESTNYFDFVAPETGYADTLSFEVGGSESVRKTFFLKVPTGYIRFKVLIVMGKDMFVTADYYFNPDGSRNLETGQVISPTQ